MSIDLTKLSPGEYRQLQRQLAAEQKSRGPSGAPRLATDLAGLKELAAAIEEYASRNDTNAVEVIDAILRALNLQYSLQSRDRSKRSSGSTPKVGGEND
jgi:hypothetical protein